MSKKIAGFGDGPASFNCEANRLGYPVTSFDPIYQFSKAALEQRIEESLILAFDCIFFTANLLDLMPDQYTLNDLSFDCLQAALLSLSFLYALSFLAPLTDSSLPQLNPQFFQLQ